MPAALAILQKIVTSRWFWIAIIAILLFFVIRKNWGVIKRFFQQSDVDKSEGEDNTIPDDIGSKPPGYQYSSKQEIKSLAQDIYTGIYATATEGSGFIISKLEEANKLTNNELKYLSEHYRKFVTKDTWLYSDIDDEWMPFTTIDETMMARLTKVGEKG